MAKFKYKAMNSNGDRIEGIHEGNSRNAVVEMISSNNYVPLMIEEIREGTDIDLSALKRVTSKDIAVFCRQFYTMLDAGLSVSSSLNVLSKQVTNKKLREAIARIDEGISKGDILSQAMSKEHKVFPQLLISMVETGEVSGNLDKIMLRMSTHYEKEFKINNKIKSAMIYPTVLGFVAVAVVTFIITFIMPIFVQMFSETGANLPVPTKLLIAISSGIANYWYFIIAVIVFLIVGIKQYFKTEQGQLFKSKFKLKFPIAKGLNEKIIVSRFTRTLATLLISGIPMVQAIQIVSGVLGNKVAEDKLLKIRESLVRGEGLGGLIEESGIFPPMLSSMIKIGEESGSLDEILNKTADFYDDELENAIQTFTSLIEPLMIVIMGFVVGFIVISIMLPMFDMYSNIH